MYVFEAKDFLYYKILHYTFFENIALEMLIRFLYNKELFILYILD